MFEKNCQKILKSLKPSDKVLDIGGWAMPFNRATHLVDLMPYETRGIHGHQGPDEEHFSKKTWSQLDISSQPLPFKDKSFDFVICSHTLEDIKDPLFACAEIIRVGKRGYIEVPSRTVEVIMGIEGARFAGYSHHHWFIDIQKNKLIFRFKNHFVHHSWRYHLPHTYIKNLRPEDQVSYLFWENSFSFEEIFSLSSVRLRKEMEEFVKKKNAYPKWFYFLFSLDSRVHLLLFIKQMVIRYPALKKVAEYIFGDRVDKSIHEELFWQNFDY